MKDFDANRNKEGNLVPDALDFMKEAANIKLVLNQTCRKITFRSAVATKMAFQNAVFDAPKVLHISCHGTKMHNKQYLIFENEYGGGDLVS